MLSLQLRESGVAGESHRIMVTPAKVVFGIICGFLAGLIFFVEAVDIFSVRNAPIVEGRIVSRAAIRQYSVPRVDFTIRIAGTDTEVHARAQQKLITNAPEVVRFHYSGNPSREVFLFEHEDNPYWLVLLFWGLALLLIVSIRSARVRKALGWTAEEK